MSDLTPIPAPISKQVDRWVDEQFDSARKWSNSELLDSGSVFTLHRLAAEIYHAGWSEGELVGTERARAEQRRDRSGGAKF